MRRDEKATQFQRTRRGRSKPGQRRPRGLMQPAELNVVLIVNPKYCAVLHASFQCFNSRSNKELNTQRLQRHFFFCSRLTLFQLTFKGSFQDVQHD